jgi:pilus assembly protein CpaC
LFRSSSFRRSETELVIIITPYLVRPVNGRLPTPVDGWRAPHDGTAILEGQTFKGVSGPRPTAALTGPGLSAGTASATASAASTPVPQAAAAAPGFKL